MRKTITESEKLQILGLLTLGIQHQNKVTDIEDALAKLTETEVGEHLSDAIYEGDTDIDGILERMGIEVTNASA